MKIKSNLDLTGGYRGLNLPSPVSNGDIVNKDYVDQPLNFSKRVYILPNGSSVSTAITTVSDMAGFTLTTTSDSRVMFYQILVNLRLIATVAPKSVIIFLVVNGSNIDTKQVNLPNTSATSFDLEFFTSIPNNATVKLQWQLGTIGGSVTAQSISGQFSTFTLIGIPNTLYTL